MPLPFHGNDEPALTLPASHVSEVEDIIETDDLVRSIVAKCIDQIALCGRTLGMVDGKHRYAELIDALGDALHDDMPAERQIGDDPFAE